MQKGERRKMDTQPEQASPDAPPETKRLITDVIAGGEQGPQSIAGSSPVAHPSAFKFRTVGEVN